MKTRIISGLVGTVILFAVLLCPWSWVFALVIAAAAAIAVWELLHNTGVVRNVAFTVVSMLYAAVSAFACGLDGRALGEPIATTPDYPLFEERPLELLAMLLAAYALFLLVSAVVFRKSFVWKGFGLTMYATLGFGSLVALRAPEHGIYYVLLPMVISWMSDTGAYFVGTFLGKHKMAPVISPKKSWEGFFGGWVISVGATVLYGYICNVALSAYPLFNLVGIAVLAAVLAPLSVCGDLLASVIKRKNDIKDYGNLMPGHGGVMDRFDSVVFIALPVYIVLAFFGYYVL